MGGRVEMAGRRRASGGGHGLRWLAAGVVVGLVASGCAYVERVSVDGAGGEANAPSANTSISADGRYVAFDSEASNLVPGDANGTWDVFVRDLVTGTTERLSVDSAGSPGNARSMRPSISGDGRYVAFDSMATNLVAGDTNSAEDVFVHDRVTGVTERVSVDSAGNQANGFSSDPAISADGRHVAFSSLATNLVAGDTNGARDVFVHDRVTGVTERVSVDSAGNQANSVSLEVAISGDGRYVAFYSLATNLVAGDTNGTRDVFVHDRVTGVTERVSVDSAGNQANGMSYEPAISGDGRYVAFQSAATNLVAGDTNGTFDVFVHDRVTGATERVSVNSAGNQANGQSVSASISADGRHVAFTSRATNLVAGDANGAVDDVFVRDRAAGVTQLASADGSGKQGPGFSSSASIAADARAVAFVSVASNLVAGASNVPDVFVAAYPRPVIASVTPANVVAGVATPITVTGTGFVDDAVLTVTNPIAGVTVTDVVVVDSTQITAVLTIAPGAPTEARNVFVQNPGTGAGLTAGALHLCHKCVGVAD